MNLISNPDINMHLCISLKSKWHNYQLLAGFLFALHIVPGYSQTLHWSFVSLGGSIEHTNGSVSHSIGQCLYTTNSAFTGSVSYGVQQPREISVVLVTDHTTRLPFSIIVFPNPTHDKICLSVQHEPLPEYLEYSMTDIYGKTLCEGTIDKPVTHIQLKSLATGVYLLTILHNGAISIAYKIIKQ